MPFGRAFLQLGETPMKIVRTWWKYEVVDFERLVDIFKGVVVHIIHFELAKATTQRPVHILHDPNLECMLKVLLVLFRINRVPPRRIQYSRFHVQDLCEMVDLQQDYVMWLMDRDVIVAKHLLR